MDLTVSSCLFIRQAEVEQCFMEFYQFIVLKLLLTNTKIKIIYNHSILDLPFTFYLTKVLHSFSYVYQYCVNSLEGQYPPVQSPSKVKQEIFTISQQIFENLVCMSLCDTPLVFSFLPMWTPSPKGNDFSNHDFSWATEWSVLTDKTEVR